MDIKINPVKKAKYGCLTVAVVIVATFFLFATAVNTLVFSIDSYAYETSNLQETNSTQSKLYTLDVQTFEVNQPVSTYHEGKDSRYDKESSEPAITTDSFDTFDMESSYFSDDKAKISFVIPEGWIENDSLSSFFDLKIGESALRTVGIFYPQNSIDSLYPQALIQVMYFDSGINNYSDEETLRYFQQGLEHGAKIYGYDVPYTESSTIDGKPMSIMDVDHAGEGRSVYFTIADEGRVYALVFSTFDTGDHQKYLDDMVYLLDTVTIEEKEEEDYSVYEDYETENSFNNYDPKVKDLFPGVINNDNNNIYA